MRIRMPPVVPDAELPVTAELSSSSSAVLYMPPPFMAEFPSIVIFDAESFPVLKIPPPWLAFPFFTAKPISFVSRFSEFPSM